MKFLTKTGSLLFLIFFVSTLLAPTQVWAQLDSSSVRDLLEERDDEIKELVGPKGTEYSQERRDKMKDLINGIIDYREMAQFALEETYHEISAEQREEFIDLFSTIVRDQSLNNLDIYRADVKYEQIKVDKEDSTAEVNTVAQLEKVRTPVIYHMKYKDNQWVVTDMVIDDVSTAESYNQQFQRIMRKRGFDGLLETLQKRADRTTS